MKKLVVSKKKAGLFRKISVGAGVMSAMASATAASAFALGSVKVEVKDTTDANALMGQIIGILLTVTRFVGIALVIYGIYEIVMSFMQNQPEAKTKGIIMAMCGVVMTALKSVLSTVGIIG